MEKAATKQYVRMFLRFVAVDREGLDFVVYFGLLRKRKPYAQQTRVFVDCETIVGDLHGRLVLRLKRRPELAAYKFLSVWSLAKRFSIEGSECIELQVGVQEWKDLAFEPKAREHTLQSRDFGLVAKTPWGVVSVRLRLW